MQFKDTNFTYIIFECIYLSVNEKRTAPTNCRLLSCKKARLSIGYIYAFRLDVRKLTTPCSLSLLPQ